MDVEKCLDGYGQYLREKGFSQNTLRSYVWVAAYFLRTYGEVNSYNLTRYREWLAVEFKATTANQRVQAINCYLGYICKPELRLRCVCVQQVTFLERAIKSADYQRFVTYLRENGYLRDHFAVRVMATTGMRVSELLRMEVCHVRSGFLDIQSKGKVRRVYLPDGVMKDLLAWLDDEKRSFGPLFLNRYGSVIAAGGLADQLKVRAAECGVDVRLVHPHAFRHLFARSFLEAGGDVVFLADLLGHSSVETTRRYLRYTSEEQRERVNRLVTW